MKCKYFKLDGIECLRKATKKYNNSFCWQHQMYNKSYVNDLRNIISKITKNSHLNTIIPGVLTVSAYANFYPICYINESDELAGIDVDIMHEFGKLFKLQLNFIIKNKFDKIWLDPINGLSDVAIGGISITSERTTPLTEWTIPYFYVDRTIIYNLKNPINKFPDDVTGIIKGTKNSTGYIDGYAKLKKVGKSNLMIESNDDKDDIDQLLKGKIQGLMRGSFVGKSIIAIYPLQLGMSKPWQIGKSLIGSYGEVFSYPTNKNSGIGILLTMLLTEDMMNHHLSHLIIKYNLA